MLTAPMYDSSLFSYYIVCHKNILDKPIPAHNVAVYSKGKIP